MYTTNGTEQFVSDVEWKPAGDLKNALCVFIGGQMFMLTEDPHEIAEAVDRYSEEIVVEGSDSRA